MIRIDASSGDGGGQRLYTALCLGAATRREVEIVNVRVGRRAPGLRHDQLAVARALAEITRGRLEGDALGSTSLRLVPGHSVGGDFELSLESPSGTAGAIAPAVLALVPVLALLDESSTLTIRGATHAPGELTTPFLQTVYAPTARKLGLRSEIATERWGWAPVGGGLLRARIEPAALRGADLSERGQLLQLGGIAVSTPDAAFAERMKNRAVRRAAEVGQRADVQSQAVSAASEGATLFLVAVFERAIAGFSAVSPGDLPAEHVADGAVDELFSYQRAYAGLDPHTAESLLVVAALATGTTTFTTSAVTEGLLSIAETTAQVISASIEIDGAAGERGEVTVVGAGPVR
jgi:RNA 3'-terminal phosphate cyclase (ATP)